MKTPELFAPKGRRELTADTGQEFQMLCRLARETGNPMLKVEIGSRPSEYICNFQKPIDEVYLSCLRDENLNQKEP